MASITIPARRVGEPASPPSWVKPQLAALVKEAPDGPDWLHEIKFDGYRMHARLHRSATHSGALDAGSVQLLTRRGNIWTDKYLSIAKAIAALPVKNAYLDGELCGVLPDGRTAFNLIQNASDTGRGSLVFFLFDLLFVDGEDITGLPLVDRKARLAVLLNGVPPSHGRLPEKRPPISSHAGWSRSGRGCLSLCRNGGGRVALDGYAQGR